MNVIDSFRLDGKVAVVTGAAGLYGRQVAEAIGEAGAELFVASRGIDKLEARAEEFRKAGLDVTALQYDQGDEAFEKYMAYLHEKHPRWAPADRK